MENKREKGLWQGKKILLKRYFTLMLAIMIALTSIPIDNVWAESSSPYEQPGDDEVILDDSVEEGEIGDIDVEINHIISKKGDKATVTVSAAPSVAGLENGVTKVTKVEIHQNGKQKKGKRVDDDWQFTVKENGTYSFIIYYSSKDGEEVLTASPSDAQKIEKETAEAQKPGTGIGGGAGGSAGTGSTETEAPQIPGEDETTADSDKETAGDATEGAIPDDDKNMGDITQGDSEKDTPISGDNNSSNNEQGNTDDKGDTTEEDTDKGSDSSDNEDVNNGTGGNGSDQGSTDSSGDESSKGESGASGGSSSSSSGDNNSGSSGSSGSGSIDNSDSSSSDSSDSDSSSDSSSSSLGGSSDSGSSNDSEGSESVVLNVIDFFFPVIDAYAGDLIVKKAVIIEYEISNLFPEGNPDDIDVDIFDEITEEGAMISLLALPSASGEEKGVREITAVELIDFEPADDVAFSDNSMDGIATASEAEETISEDDIETASPSDAATATEKTSNAKHAEYQKSEVDGDEYRFFVKANGTYTFSIRYGTAADSDFEDSTALVETQFPITYELESVEENKITFLGVEDTQIKQGTKFNLLEGVQAVNSEGVEVAPVEVLDDGGFDSKKPGDYFVTYTTLSGNSGIMMMALEEENAIPESAPSTVVRMISVKAAEGGTLELISETGKFKKDMATLPDYYGEDTLRVTYMPSLGVTNRYLELVYPGAISLQVLPGTDSTITNITQSAGLVRFYIADNVEEEISFNFKIYYSGGRDTTAYDTWTYTNEEVTTGGPITIQELYGDGIKGGEAKLAEMIFAKPEAKDIRLSYPDSINNVVVTREGAFKNGGLATGVFWLVNNTSERTAVDYVKVYWPSAPLYSKVALYYKESNGAYTDVILSEESGKDSKGNYTKYLIKPDYKRNRISLYASSSIGWKKGDPYLLSESTILNVLDKDIEVGYTSAGESKTLLYEYRPTITVEKWKELDYDIEYGNVTEQNLDGKDKNSKYIHIGRSDYMDGSYLRDKGVNVPGMKIVEEADSPVDSTCTYYTRTPYTTEAVLTMELPYEVDLDFRLGGASLSKAGIKSVSVIFSDGSKQTIEMNDGDYNTPWRKFSKPEEAKVKKIEFIYNGVIDKKTSYGDSGWEKLNNYPNFDFISGIRYICGTTHEDGTPIRDGEYLNPIIFKAEFKETESGKKFKNFYQELELIAKDVEKTETILDLRFDDKVENSLSYYSNSQRRNQEWLNGQIYQFHIRSYKKSSALESKEWVNPTITLEAYLANEKSMTFLTGEMTCNSFLNGWSITYSTRDKGEQKYLIPDTEEEWQKIKLLSDGDEFDSQEISFSKEGVVIPIEEKLIKEIRTEIRAFNEGDRSLYGDVDEVNNNKGGLIQVDYRTSINSQGIESGSDSMSSDPTYTHALSVMKLEVNAYAQTNAYQGSTLTQSVGMRNAWQYPKNYANQYAGSADEFISAKLRKPDNFIYYVKVTDSDTFHMVKDSISASTSAVIENVLVDGELWYKITSTKEESINIGFYVDPAAPLGTVPDSQKPKVELYTDLSGYLEKNGLYKNQIEVRLKDAVTCPIEPEKGEVFMHGIGTLGASEVLLNSVAGAQLSLGAGGSYSRPEVSFQGHEKDLLEALLSFGAKNSNLYNIEVLVNIPKKGDVVQYSEASEIKNVSSEYDIFLTDKVTPSTVPAGGSISYFYEEDGEWKENPVSWKDVTRIKIKISELAPDNSATFKIPLSTGTKDVDGDLNGYMSTAWKFTNTAEGETRSDYTFGVLNTYKYMDYIISGNAWNDINENGRMDNTSGENKISGVKVELYRGDTPTPIAETTTATDGSYQFETRYDGGLKLKIEPPIGMLLTEFEAVGAISTQNSKFVRDNTSEDYLVAKLPDSFAGDVQNMNAGFITPPTIIMDNIRVKFGQTTSAKASAASAAPDKLKVYYTQAEDPAIASLKAGSDGSVLTDEAGNVTIQGNKLSEVTTATAWAENSLGDKVSTTYQIAVSDDKAPVFTASHSWVAIEGDTIPDFWAGIEAEDPEEEYPAWKIVLFGAAGMSSRSIESDGKTFAVYENSDFTGEISLAGALNAKGNYYVRYTVEDDMGNAVTADTTLTVYGRIQGDDVEKHYFATGETIPVPAADFYYLDPAGAVVSATDGIQYKDVSQWTLNEGVLAPSNQTVTHPMADNVTEGVVAGSGRTAAAVAKGAIDSKVTIINTRPSYDAMLNEDIEVGWTLETDTTYNHWTVDGIKTTEIANCEIKKADGTVMPDNFKQDTSTPVLAVYEKYGVSPENYDNQDALGGAIKNEATVEETIRVIGKPVVEAETIIYVTPEQAKRETAVNGKLSESASYHDGENEKAAVPDENITINYIYTDDIITSVEIQAWAGRADNLSDVHTVTVVAREIPALTVSDIHLREGDTFTPDDGHNKELTPSDEHNAYEMVASNVDTSAIGKYEVDYKTKDALTGAGEEAREAVYVHGKPVIAATDKSLYTHESTGADALIDAVKVDALAKVSYVDSDGTTREIVIPASKLHYEVEPGYEPGKEGRFKVTVAVDDTDYVPTGLAPVQAVKEVYVEVTNQVFDVTFSTNNDGLHNKGTIDGGTVSIKRPTIYGEAAAIPVPAASEGYHFDGYKTLDGMTASQDINLPDGSVIPTGSTIPVGTLLSEEQVAGIRIYGAVRFEAYFSSTPVITGQNIKLYVGETYEQSSLSINVSDLDGNANITDIADQKVDTSKAGTYQVKVSVTDADGNHTEKYVYVQVFGKATLEGYEPIHTRKDTNLSEDELKGSIKAVYDAPPAIPDSPWEDDSQLAVKTEIPYTLTGTVDTTSIGLTTLAIKAEGQITGRGADGEADAARKVYVHGKPIITANDGALFTHESTGQDSLIDLIKQSAQATIQYVEVDGTLRTVSVPADDLNFEIKSEEQYAPHKEGTYKVTITLNDAAYVPNGLVAMDTELEPMVIVSDKTYEVKFSINNDGTYHKGDFEGGTSGFTTNVIHGNPVARMPVPVAMEGYHFDGYKVMNPFTTMDEIQLSDGTIIPEGGQIPAGSILTDEQVRSLKFYDNVEFQAYFSASPSIKGENVVLYEGEEYKQDRLHIEVSDADNNTSSAVIDDAHINTGIPGTYQIKVTVSDTDGNTAEKYVYVQIIGKTTFSAEPALHTRKGTELATDKLLDGVKAVYHKPLDIPEEPWADAGKINNGQPAVVTEVEIQTFDTVNTDTIRKTKISYTAPGMIHGREMIGNARGERDIYIHGLPVVVAYDNGLNTHQSTSDGVLKQVVLSGQGTVVRDAASAYVEYVQPDGTINKVNIVPDKISYSIVQYVPMTAGEYMVTAVVDDSTVLSQANAAGLEFASGKKEVKIVVADKMYTVMFEMGEHGGLENPADAITSVAHGKTASSPVLAPEEGYQIDYWTDEGGNKVNLSAVVITDNRKFTAQFKIKEFTVRFIGKKERVIKTELVKYGQDATPPTEDRDVKNNRFDGWSASYLNIKSDMDIYTTYWSNKGGGGGPSGGGSYIPTGPGVTITGEEVPKSPSWVLDDIGGTQTPIANRPITSTGIPMMAGLPKTGDITTGFKSGIGYQAVFVDGSTFLSEEEPLVGHPGGLILPSLGSTIDWRKCILHIILLIISALEGIYYILKRRKDKKILEELRKELEKEEEQNA